MTASERYACWALVLGMAGGCQVNPDSEPGVDAFLRRLSEDGYEVQQGATAPLFLEDCESLPTCFQQNATSPYINWFLPAAPGQPESSTSELPLPQAPPGMSATWKLREDEAVLFIGRTAPPVAYYSVAPYLFGRVDSQTGQRVPVFASLADATNQATITTAGDLFDQEVVFLLTADRTLDDRIRQMLDEHEIAPGGHNTMPLAAADLRMGLGEDADTFLSIERFALFEDEAVGRAYLEDPSTTLLRITPRQEQTIDPFDTPTRAERGTGTDESALTPALDALEVAIREVHGERNVEALTMIPATAVAQNLDHRACIENLTDCLGEVSDAAYSAGPFEVLRGDGELRLSESEEDFFVAFGVNHERAGKATYSNMVVNNLVKQAGIAAADSRDMVGSARVYLPDHPDVDDLFAIRVARRCTVEFCIEVPIDFPGVGLDEDLGFVFRAYLEPGRPVAPAPEELTTERILHFTP